MWRYTILGYITDAITDVETRRWLETPEARGIMSYCGMGRNVEPLSTLWDACDLCPQVGRGLKSLLHTLASVVVR